MAIRDTYALVKGGYHKIGKEYQYSIDLRRTYVCWRTLYYWKDQIAYIQVIMLIPSAKSVISTHIFLITLPTSCYESGMWNENGANDT